MKLSKPLSILTTLARAKMYRIKSSRGTKQKLPREIALDHFDFFYGPIFKNRWNSIRLGLLTDQKLCALINNFTTIDGTIERLIDSGAIDMKDLLLETTETSSDGEDRHSTKKRMSDIVVRKQIRSKVTNEQNFDVRKNRDNFLSTNSEDLYNEDEDMKSRSSPESIYSFVPSSDRVVRLRDDFEVSSMLPEKQSFMGPADIRIVPDDDIIYPDMLKVLLYPRGDITTFDSAQLTAENVPAYYLMDASTIFAVLALNLKLDDQVLDMCVSPGGTSLSMLQTFLPDRIVCNDVTMRIRGRQTLEDFIPVAAKDIRSKVALWYKDPSIPDNWDRDAVGEKFHKVLINAPCTYDRESLSHLADDEPSLFSEGRNAEKLKLPFRQAELLKAGLLCLKPGGSLVYTTQTFSPIQNDSVIDNALNSLNNEGQISRLDSSSHQERTRLTSNDFVINDLSVLAEKFCRAGIFRFFPFCRYGELIMPNICSNFGPAYVCKFTRKLEKS